MARKRFGRGVKSGADMVDKVARAYKLPGILGRHRLFAIWEQIVGERYAEVCEPQKLIGDTLVVRVVDSVWGNQIRMLESEFVERIAEETGNEAVKKLRVVTGHVEGSPRKPKAPSPLSEVDVETADIEQQLDQTPLRDKPQLKETMARLWANARRLAKRRREASAGK